MIITHLVKDQDFPTQRECCRHALNVLY